MRLESEYEERKARSRKRDKDPQPAVHVSEPDMLFDITSSPGNF